MRRWRKGTMVAGAVMFVANATHAATVDLRDCPLDTVTFSDPWADGSFVVERVGTRYEYLCEEGFLKHPPADEECGGPYGELALQGHISASGEGKILAIWYVYKAAPCCGWLILDANAQEGRELARGVTWLEGKEVPTLRDVPFLTIDKPEDKSGKFGNPLSAVSCQLR